MGVLWNSLMQKPNYSYGIGVQFEPDTPVAYEYAIAERYVEQYQAELLDDPLPHDYMLVFPNLSERQVKEIVGILMDTDYVLRSIFVTVDIVD